MGNERDYVSKRIKPGSDKYHLAVFFIEGLKNFRGLDRKEAILRQVRGSQSPAQKHSYVKMVREGFTEC